MNPKQPAAKKIVTELPETKIPVAPVELIESQLPTELPEKKSSKKSLSTKPDKATKDKDEQAPVKKSKHDKEKVIKVIRDSFSFPEQDYRKISELKQICLAEGISIKKGEILRAGLHLLSELTLPELKKAIAQVEKVKTGRPNVLKKQ